MILIKYRGTTNPSVRVQVTVGALVIKGFQRVSIIFLYTDVCGLSFPPHYPYFAL